MGGTILIIEDESVVSETFKAVFEGGVHAIKAAATFQEFLDLIEGLQVPLVVLVDEHFPGGNGAQAAKLLREKIPGVKLISTSGDRPEDITWSPDAFFRKPPSIVALMAKVEEFMAD